MSLDTKAPVATPSQMTPPNPVSPAEQFVETQLATASRQVRLNDVLAGLVAVAVWIFSILFIGVCVDGWLYPLGFATRALFLGILVVGTLALIYRTLGPAFLRRINPKYSAKMIESANQKFQNSLINYSYIKDRPELAKPALLQAVSKKAATDLASVSRLEQVDRSEVIRLGIALVCCVALFVLYTVLSPKSPWPSVVRILNPNSAMVQPSVVSIANVDPGDAEVFFGERLLVSAAIRGPHLPESVILVYSSQDGRADRVSLPMRAVDDMGRYQAELSNGSVGIDSPLEYHIEAGDGRSPSYQVTVRPNPTITVDTITVTPPAYTRLNERILTGTAELSGPEGSLMRIRATANLPIRVAYIELLGPSETSTSQGNLVPVASVEMTENGNQADGEVLLLFDRIKKRPQFTHFQLKFVSEGGDRNTVTNTYSVRVIPDLAPEIQLINPTESELRIPVNGSVPIEIRANDLDYEIASLKLAIDHQGSLLLDDELELPRETSNQVVTSKFLLQPAKLRLAPGDTAILYAVAGDNRTSPYNPQLPEPNLTRTRNIKVLVEPPSVLDQPDNDANPQDGRDARSETNPPGENQDEGQKDPSEKSGEDQRTPDQGNAEKPTDPKADAEQKPGGEKDESQAAPPTRNEGSPESNKESSDSRAQDQGGRESGGEAQTESGDSTGGNRSERPDTPPQNSTGQAQNASDPGSQPGGDAGNPNSAGQSGQPSKSQEETGKAQPSPAEEARPEAGGPDGERDRSLSEGEAQPLSDDATDAERFENLKRMIEQRQNQPSTDDPGNTNPSADSPSQPGQDNEAQPNSDRPPNDNRPAAQPGDKPAPGADDSTSPEGQAEGSEGGHPDRKPADPNPGAGNQGSAQNPKPQDSTPTESSENSGAQPPADRSGANQEGVRNPEASGTDNSDNSGGKGTESNAEPKAESAENPNAPGAESESNSQPEGQPGTTPSDAAQGSPDKGNDSGAAPNPQGSQDAGQDSSSNPQPPDGEKGRSSSTASGEGSGDRAPRERVTGGSDFGSGNEDQSSPQSPQEDQASLDYSKEVTDLVLKYLREQKTDPDPELLEQMNWTAEELREFLQRWEAMAEGARKGEAASKRKYENALRSLGLSPQRTQQSTLSGRAPRMENLSEESAVNRPPPELADEFNAFLRGRGRVTPPATSKPPGDR